MGQTDNKVEQNKDIVVIAKGAGIGSFGRIFKLGMNFTIRLIIARCLSLEAVGLYFLGMTVVQFSQIITTMGFDMGLLKFASVAHSNNDLNKVKGYVNMALKIVLPVALIFSLCMFIFADLISVRIFHNHELSKVVRVFAITIPIAVITTIFVSTTQAFKKIQYKVYVEEIAKPVVQIIALTVFIFIGYKLMGALAAYIISIVFGLLLSIFFLNKDLPFRIKAKINQLEMKTMLKYSLTQTFSKIIGELVIMLDTFMIGYFLVVSDVGIYNISTQITRLGLLFLFSFNQICLPIISQNVSKGDFKQIGTNFRTVTKLIFTLSFPLYLIMIVFPKESLMIFGKDYSSAGFNCLLILALGQIINTSTGPLGPILNMSGKHVLNLYDNMGMLLLNIILNYFLIPKYGIAGAAIATSISISLANLIRLIQVFYIFGIHPYNLSYLKPFFLGILSITIFYIIKQHFLITLNIPSFLLLASFYLGTYFLFLKLLGFTEEENILLNKIKSKLLQTV